MKVVNVFKKNVSLFWKRFFNYKINIDKLNYLN